MNFKRGNTYKLQGIIEDVDIDDISKVVFKFNDIKKIYLSDGTGDVQYVDGIFIISLSQEETLRLKERKSKI